MIKILIMFSLFYIIPSLLKLLGALIKNYFTRGQKKLTKPKSINFIPSLPFFEKIKQMKKFGFKRYSKKIVLILSYILLPLIHAFIFALYENWIIGIIINLILFGLWHIVIYVILQKYYNYENKLLDNLLQFKQSKMKLNDTESNIFSYSSEFEILQWDENNAFPVKIKFYYSVNFDTSQRTLFLGSFNEKFANNKIWRVDEQDGWDDNNNSITLNLVDFLDEKQKIFINNFLDFKRQYMKLKDNNSNLFTYENEFEVLKWEEGGRASKVRLYFPITFDSNMGKDNFLDKMSINFGGGRPYEVDEEDKDYPGWNTNLLIATIKLEAPLPEMAMFDEMYILNDSVQWSFFPLGIGSRMGIPFKNPKTGVEERLLGFDVSDAQSEWCKDNGHVVGNDLMASPHAILCGVTGGGKSVCQRNVILSCLIRPKDWMLMIIDLKMVEGAMWRKYGVPVADSYETAAQYLDFAQVTMMERFEQMKLRGISDWGDMPVDKRGPAIMVNVDEISQLLAPIKGKTDIEKENADYQGRCNAAIENIARLGRAARVHLIVAGQRPSSDVVSMQIRQNCPTRIGAGSIPPTISQMVFDSPFGATIPSKPKGRVGLKIHSMNPVKLQGFFADGKWMDRYLEKHNLPTMVYDSQNMAQIYQDNLNQANNDIDGMSQEDYDEIERALNG